MNRKIKWVSKALADIEAVYQRAQKNEGLSAQMEQLETRALEEARNNIGRVQNDRGAHLTPEQFDSLPDIDKETVIGVLGDRCISTLKVDNQTQSVIVKLGPSITKVQACTVLNLLNRIEALDGAITVPVPKWTLALHVPLGGKKGLFQWEIMIMRLYPWLSVREESTNEVAEPNQAPEPVAPASPPKAKATDPFVEEMSQYPAFTTSLAKAKAELENAIQKQLPFIPHWKDRISVEEWNALDEFDRFVKVLSLGLFGIVIDKCVCIDFSEDIPNCIAIALLFLAVRGNKPKQLIDAGDGTDIRYLVEALTALNVCCRDWVCTIANPSFSLIGGSPNPSAPEQKQSEQSKKEQPSAPEQKQSEPPEKEQPKPPKQEQPEPPKKEQPESPKQQPESPKQEQPEPSGETQPETQPEPQKKTPEKKPGFLARIFGSLFQKTQPEQRPVPQRTSAAAPQAQTPPQNHPAADATETLKKQPKVYITVNRNIPELYPAFDIDGHMHVFTEPSAAAEDLKNGLFRTEEMTGRKLCEVLESWADRGVRSIRFVDGSETKIWDAVALGLRKDRDNVTLQNTMIRYRQTQEMPNKTAASRATAETYMEAILHAMPGTFFWVPFLYEGENLGGTFTDRTLHLFPHAAMRLTELMKQQRLPTYDMPFAAKAGGRAMHYCIVTNSVSHMNYLAAFTSCSEMMKLWDGRSRYALATFEDMKDQYHPAQGILLNSQSACFVLTPELIQRTDRGRKEPQKVDLPQYPVTLYENRSISAKPPYLVLEFEDGVYMQVVDLMQTRIFESMSLGGMGLLTNEYSIALFRMKPEEIAWVNKEPAKLDNLAARLFQNLPADRLVRAAVVNRTNNQTREIHCQTGCDTID